jgi:hypothetical protein
VDRPGQVQSLFPVLMVAFAWAAAFLSARVTRPAVWAPIVAMISLASLSELLSGYADAPLAYLLCLGALGLGLWLESGRRSDLALGMLMLAGAASIKNEGLVGTMLMLGVAGAVLALRRWWPVLREFVLGSALLVVVGVLPWRLWLAVNHLHGDIPVSKGISPGFLADHVSRVRPSLEALYTQLSAGGFPALLVPLGLAIVLVRLRGRDASPAAGFYLATGLAYFGSLVWAYWISPLDLAFHLQTSANRVVLSVMFVGAAALLHLTGRPGEARAPS